MKIQVRIDEYMRESLEKYIFNNGLYKERVKLNEVATKIVIEWLNNPVLDRKNMIYSRANEFRNVIIIIFLSEKQYEKIYKILVSDYGRDCRTPNTLIYNIIKQFIESKGLN